MSGMSRKRLGTPVRRRIDIVKEREGTFLRLRMGGNAILGLRVIDPAAKLVEMTEPGGKKRKVTIEQIRPGARFNFTVGQTDTRSGSTVKGIFRS